MAGCHLTTCKSAAGDQLPARTNQRFLWLASRNLAPTGSAGPLRPVGCICGLGATSTGFSRWLAGRRRSAAVPNDPRQRPQGVVHGRGVGEYFRHIWFKNHDVAPCHASSVGIPAAAAEVVFRKDLVRVEAANALSASLLHSDVVRDESLSGR
jgi:hypothetical protein